MKNFWDNFWGGSPYRLTACWNGPSEWRIFITEYDCVKYYAIFLGKLTLCIEIWPFDDREQGIVV